MKHIILLVGIVMVLLVGCEPNDSEKEKTNALFYNLSCEELERGWMDKQMRICGKCKCKLDWFGEWCDYPCTTYTRVEIEHQQLLKGCFK